MIILNELSIFSSEPIFKHQNPTHDLFLSYFFIGRLRLPISFNYNNDPAMETANEERLLLQKEEQVLGMSFVEYMGEALLL